MYKRILVAVDGSAASRRGLDEAIRLAGHLKSRMLLVHVIEPWVMLTDTTPSTLHQLAEATRSGGARLLEECEDKVAKAGIEVESELVETVGTPAGECIAKKAAEAGADLIVCGTHGRRGIRRLLMGSDAEQIVRRAPVPVLLVRQEEAASESA
ncbi:MAG TPA: universal stress protein [Steroidobacteraceae bacterium]